MVDFKFHMHVARDSLHMPAKFEVCSYNHFELLAFNAPRNSGSRDPGHSLFSKNFEGVMS